MAVYQAAVFKQVVEATVEMAIKKAVETAVEVQQSRRLLRLPSRLPTSGNIMYKRAREGRSGLVMGATEKE
jgi:hypothetical protein